MAVQLALAMLSDGRAKSKEDAAKQAGINPCMLKPAALARFVTSNPIGRQIARDCPNVLAITEKIAGKSVSMQEALSTGARSSLRILARLGKRIGKLDDDERKHLRDARSWLEMSKSLGLFAPAEPLALPAELQNQAQSQPPPADEPAPEGGVSDFLGDPQSSAEDEGGA